MSNVDTVNALITAINFDRYAEIEALHAPDAVFHSFRGPTLHTSVAIADWHEEFLRDYADCNYTDLEYVEDGDVVAVRATIEAKAVTWRPFTQRIVEVFRVNVDGIAERRLYGMVPDLELDKAAAAAMTNARGYRGGDVAGTRQLVRTMLDALTARELDAARACFDDKAVVIDSLYGVAAGFDNIAALFAAIPRPAFGVDRATAIYAGEHDALVEMAIDPSRPRAAAWVRVVDGKILVFELHWMFREIGVDPFAQQRPRHTRQVILPV